MSRPVLAAVAVTLILTACGGGTGIAPSARPSILPSPRPSAPPTGIRSVAPTPGLSPLATPTPSAAATAAPTPAATAAPTPVATAAPTPVATAIPSSLPTAPAASQPAAVAPATPPAATPEQPPTQLAPSPVATDEGTPSGWWWLVLLLIAIAVAGSAWAVLRRRSPAANWTRGLQEVATDLRWVEDELMPRLMEAENGEVFAQVWNGGRPRLVAADQALYGLAESAPDEDATALVGNARKAVAGLLSAVDAEARLAPDAGVDAWRAARAGVERARSEMVPVVASLPAADSPRSVGRPQAE